MPMNQSLDASPEGQSKIAGINNGQPEDLRRVARYQRGIIGSLALYAIALTSIIAAPGSEVAFLICVLGYLAAAMSAAAFIFLLASKLYSLMVGILLGLLTILVPIIGIIVLLVVNAKATSVLRQNGITVGLSGAKLSQLN
jgi:hypothetical protein|tara:strand:+ start:883 stop:1305 length:423 start_codon:yes stop_codon:yes gene_type:complete